MPIEIGKLLDQGPWPRFAKLVTLLCALAIIFDGFDISIVGFAIPSMIRDLRLPRASFAPLLVIGFVGMIIGSTSAGIVADRLGRRAALFWSVLVFGVAIVLSSFAPNLLFIEVLRFIAAAGIGGALPNAATMSAEFTPLKMRSVAVMLTIVCVPLGGALAGSVASWVLPVAGWRALFLVGGIAPLVLSLVMLALMPESPRFLARKPHRAGELTRLLGRLKQSVPAGATFVESMTDRPETPMSLKDLFGAGQTRSTLALWLAFFSSLSGIYLCFSWLPTLLSANGLDLSAASKGLAVYNYGGVAGVLCFVALVNRLGSRILTLAASSLAALTALVLITIEIKPGSDPVPLLATLAAHGFCVNAVQTSLFALGVHIYPTRVRASGVAIASAIGRLGAIVSASTGSLVIQHGRVQFFEVLTMAAFFSFVGLSILRNHIPSMGTKKIVTLA
jgi:AAHS family 4-hydroxybenzoate transporter-like MFS transporter